MRLALALGVVGAALAAAPAQAAVVAVTDTGLRDFQTRIFTGQRVSFTNLTGAAVTIDSTGRPSFDDLALPPGGDRPSPASPGRDPMGAMAAAAARFTATTSSSRAASR
jgi:hypothetical protein